MLLQYYVPKYQIPALLFINSVPSSHFAKLSHQQFKSHHIFHHINLNFLSCFTSYQKGQIHQDYQNDVTCSPKKIKY